MTSEGDKVENVVCWFVGILITAMLIWAFLDPGYWWGAITPKWRIRIEMIDE